MLTGVCELAGGCVRNRALARSLRSLAVRLLRLRWVSGCRYSGADYKDVVKENEQMKDIIRRMHRQITTLAGACVTQLAGSSHS